MIVITVLFSPSGWVLGYHSDTSQHVFHISLNTIVLSSSIEDCVATPDSEVRHFVSCMKMSPNSSDRCWGVNSVYNLINSLIFQQKLSNIFRMFKGVPLNDYKLIRFAATWQQQKSMGKGHATWSESGHDTWRHKPVFCLPWLRLICGETGGLTGTLNRVSCFATLLVARSDKGDCLLDQTWLCLSLASERTQIVTKYGRQWYWTKYFVQVICWAIVVILFGLKTSKVWKKSSDKNTEQAVSG